MITLRHAADRGQSRTNWLDSRHTFSFADYHDPAHMGFRALRVLNDDRIAPGAGFGPHGHRDMEILTFVLDGELEHRDSTGGHGRIVPGTVQRMRAGTGIVHSEMNASAVAPLRLLQIWIVPAEAGLAPGYAERRFRVADAAGALPLVAAPDGAGGALDLAQDARVYAGALAQGRLVETALAPGRHAWVQVASGAVDVNEVAAAEGDGVALADESTVRIGAREDAEVVLFDLA